jgi:CTP:molybdopterin cytidylyltransferase MocA
VGVVLAAGAGRRFGGAKALATLHGTRLVDHAVRVLREGGCTDVLVVAGAVPLRDVDADVVTNVDWPTGMASSLRVGLDAATHRGDWPAAVLLLVDTPWIGAEAVRRLIEAAEQGVADDSGGTGEVLAVQAAYDGVPAHPVLLARQVWPDAVAAASGDQGARVWLRGHPDDVVLVECADTGHPRDVDVPDDLPSDLRDD